MTRTVVAFDHDRTLTRPPVRRLAQGLDQHPDVTVGVVSGAPRARIQPTLRDADLDPAFLHSRVLLKGRALRCVQRQHPADRFVYVGDRFLDHAFAAAAGWTFVPAAALSHEK